MNPENIARFLAELTALSKKYGITVGSCGCCKSIFLDELKDINGTYTFDPSNNDKLKWKENTP